MNDLVHDLTTLARRHPDGSHQVRDSRKRMLVQMARHLGETGCRPINKASDLDGEHVGALANYWKQQNLSRSTIKSRASVLRWWAAKVDKASIVPPDNAAFGVVPPPVQTVNEDRQETVDAAAPSEISEEYARASLALQACFALSRDESIKFMPAAADLGDRIRLRGAWCKGERSREIPIRTERQREALDRARKLAGDGAMIPESVEFAQQARAVDEVARSTGQRYASVFRAEYAQARYQELAGRACAKRGGPGRSELNQRDQLFDRKARESIASELGFRTEAALGALIGG